MSRRPRPMPTEATLRAAIAAVRGQLASAMDAADVLDGIEAAHPCARYLREADRHLELAGNLCLPTPRAAA